MMPPRLLLCLLPFLLGSGTERAAFEKAFVFKDAFSQDFRLKSGEAVEVSAGVPSPSELPANGRLAVEWGGYRKVLHAFDPDIYMVFRAPADGTYTLRISPVTDEEPIFNHPRWREDGVVGALNEFPGKTPAPRNVKVRASVRPFDAGESTRGMHIEMEPNDSIDQAQRVLVSSDKDETVHVTGGSDEIEYFDNGKAGESGDDWFRIEHKGAGPKLLTCNVITADPLVVARLRFYKPDGTEYREGANENERVHQQQEEHRTEINRTLEPGGVYFLRVEANSPGYDLELRTRKPAPYTDPREAVRQAMYDHLAQVDAWLLNRPRGASVERRIRDTGNLLGTHCMSCHTQSGAWGPTVPMLMGYRPENIGNYRHLVSVMYESLRPANVLVDAVNNTSLPPLDLGDGPAGTRVAGYNVATVERFLPPRKLHSRQQIRTANFVLQSNDPSGVNAAGPGSNVGQAVVLRYAGEILRTAWDKTKDEKYKKALEEKSQKMLKIAVKYTDDLAHRIEFYERVYPRDWRTPEIDAQLDKDERELRGRQNEDGSWEFNTTVPVSTGQNSSGKEPKGPDPAPTSLALSALQSRGFTPSDPAVSKGVAVLLRMQEPYGRWNKTALTGFVTTAYALHALALLYPETAPAPARRDFEPREGESLLDTVARFRALAHLLLNKDGLNKDDRQFLHLIRAGGAHRSPHVRYWAMIGLGSMPEEQNAGLLLQSLGDPVKMVREAARWGLRQNLLDDKGWKDLFAAYPKAGDITRAQMAGALIMRADATTTQPSFDPGKVAGMLAQMMNEDKSPAARAWATRAAWNWWIWNPPVRLIINDAWVRMLESPEPSVLAENAKRYQSQALFIANGHKANGSEDHQYPELEKLFEVLSAKLDKPSEPLVSRITAIAGTYYGQAGGDGGPGQMGYVTKHSSEMAGKAVMAYWTKAEKEQDADCVRLSVEAAANAAYDPMQKKLLDYAVSGPEHLRTIAATSASDPSMTSLPGTQEFLEPLIQQLNRGAADKDRRSALAAPIIRLFTRARWNIPKTQEQQDIFYGLLKPRLDDPESDTQWYLAEQLGRVFASNPDLRTETLIRSIPQKFGRPLEEYFWLASVPWMLTYGTAIPEPGKPAAEQSPLQGMAEQLFIRQLSPEAEPKLKKAAIAMAGNETVRNNPVIAAVLKAELPEYFEPEVPEVQAMSPERRVNFDYFRRHVVPEIRRPNRQDERACITCHGVAGRVPSMELAPADKSGYMDVQAVWANYRILLDRVNVQDVESSKLLRKPLNVQTGKEDGHQGGRRYLPDDRGYEILKRWARHAAELKKAGL